ncbi:D-alanyl-D-alanine carboxypeptidase family protein [Streptomyces kebangsaanensis]|uniref:D-alanyl-D-alanine carboxypeptidase n=1 Tax=Streptomyces kebangsaanensis TaxID=864058 RepID=UPI0009A10768|nr:D-alanyl-D-alanine carboxypeptidase [Streptomyces kebangsaanensis]
MEEASVAGESPDRSKQRESSVQPTSGSAGPVSEARGEARDPRLPLTGDAGAAGVSADSGTSGASEGRGGVDTATRVLSVRDLATDGEDAGDAGAAEKPGRAARAGGTDGAKGDAKAVDGAEKAGETSRDSDSGDEDSGDEDGAPGEARLREADTEDAEDAEDAEKGPATPRADGAGEVKETRETAASRETEGSEDVAEAGDAEHDGAARDSVRAAADDDADNEGDDTPSGAAGGRPEKAARPAGAAKAAEDAAEVDATAADDSAADDADAEGTDGADDGPKSGDRPPVDQPTTMLKVGGAAKPRVDQPTTMLKLGGGKKKDQQDQQGRQDGQDKEKQDAHAPESDAERTSKFVALKSLDAPEARKPKPAEPAAPPKAPADATAAVPQIGPERTTQQPLPPKPPLDLLAELTNTPPPPETPMRTLVRRVKIWTPLVVLLAIVFAIVQAVRPLPAPTLALSAEETYTFDGDQVKLPWPDEGQGWMDVDGVGTMDHFGEQKPVPIASVTKTMTAYIILRDHPLKPGEEGPKIEIDPTAEKEAGYHKEGESTLDNVKAGEFLTEKQALSAVMIPSANNIARLLARWDAGSEEAFVKKMNDTARELGMTNTTYTDPSGLNKTTVSTAGDQVKLGIAAMRIPAMVDITSAASWTDPKGKYWSNFNQLPFTIGAIGIKTGSTTAAGGNLLFAARKEVGGRTVTIVGAILGQYKAQSILDLVNAVSKTALLAAQDVPTSAKILKKGDVVGYVDDQLGGHTPVVVTEDVTAVGWAGLEVKLSLAAKDVPSVGKAGDEVGTLTVGDGEDGAVKVPVALQEDLAEPGFTARLTRLG